jgi:hypothetical protein
LLAEKAVGKPSTVRINLASEQELLELPGLGAAGAAAIVRYRTERGPIRDAAQLASILRGHPNLHAPNLDAMRDRLDFSPSDTTAPEAPGA